MVKDKEITMIVNGREKKYNNKEISFNEVIRLAFGKVDDDPRVVYTVTYSKNSNQGGSMSKGDTIKVKKGMIFNVTRTDKS